MSKRILCVVIVLVFSFAGCAYNKPAQVSGPKKWDGNIVNASRTIVNTLENNLSAPISNQDSIIVASFVDVSDLTKSSPFGRIMAEQIGSGFSQKGYKVIEMKLRQNSIFVDDENKGEFLLSRNVREISRNHNASAVVVGTYAQGHSKVYVSARIVNPVTSVILSACDYELDFHFHRNYKEMTYLMKK
ncbi:MAG: FlgO family outer membrane protein [Bacteroidales bacterium]